MFHKHSITGKIVILIVYVDDIIFTGDDEGKLKVLKKFHAREFEVKDLGMEFARSKKGIFVTQRKFVLDLLEETNLLGCKPVETPNGAQF